MAPSCFFRSRFSHANRLAWEMPRWAGQKFANEKRLAENGQAFELLNCGLRMSEKHDRASKNYQPLLTGFAFARFSATAAQLTTLKKAAT